MDAKELKPCPFCGATASLNSDHVDFFVMCDTCSGEGPRLQSPTGNHEASKRGAVAVWNKRVALHSDAAQAPIARSIGEWHEDHGNAIWFTWQDGEWLGEPSYIGQPNDSDWPGYHTHWIPHPAFPAPARTYTTQPGESVAGIALRQIGNEAKWRNILECNPKFEDLRPNDYFPVSTVLMLPSIAAPVAPAAAAPLLNAPEGDDPMKHGDRSIEASLKRLTEAYCKQQPLPIPDQMALVWRFDIGRLRNDWIRLNAWQKSELGTPQAAQPDERAGLETVARLSTDAVTQLSTKTMDKPVHRMSDAERDVLAERARQVSVEGWTPTHDDQNSPREMPCAAAAYALSAAGRRGDGVEVWPLTWAYEWWKPTTPRRDLVKAGALIIAEIERIDRAGVKA